MKYYYFEENGIAQGPFTLDELISKKIRKGTLVWTNGMDNWAPAEKVEELKDLIVPTPPPLPPPLPKKDNESFNEIASNIIVSKSQDVKEIIISGFKAVKIGSQIWMTENLNVDKFRNGDRIPETRTDIEWERAGRNQEPAWCFFDNDPANGKKYGKLYNWSAVIDPRGLAPQAWHIPSETDWNILINYLGGGKSAGPKMKSKIGWINGQNITNESGFSALPGSSRSAFGEFGIDEIGYLGTWWSSSLGGRPTNSTVLLITDDEVDTIPFFNRFGKSVRCLKD